MDGLGKPRELLVWVGARLTVLFEGGSERRLRRWSSRPPLVF